MATAFLTGIVAETQRFSNEKTSSDTMNISAKLMAAGANQQLVATKLEQPEPEQTIPPPDTNESPAVPVDAASSDGSLNIDHAAEEIEAQTELSASMPPEIMEQAQTIP